MVTLGVDSHKQSHTVVAVDEHGRQLQSLTTAATEAGHLAALGWASSWPQRQWGLEDCRQVSRGLERDLLRAGERVVRVPPKLTVKLRRSGRAQGKSDAIDARAVARALLGEPGLPVAQLEGPSREVKQLLDYRESVVRERTRLQNRLRWLLHELQPGYQVASGTLDRGRVLDQIGRLLEARPETSARLARRQLARIRELTLEVRELEREIAAWSRQLTPPPLQLTGCGPLRAPKLLGESADITRFRSPAAYAMHDGTAPIPACSGNTSRHRLNRGGNRQLNYALHIIAITQLRLGAEGALYVERRMAAGKTRKEAIRAPRPPPPHRVY